MNFDLNTLSTLMQLMGKQPKSEPPHGTKQPAQTGQRASTSSFVLENGIGEKVRIEAEKTTSTSSASPLAGILELMGGRSGGGDGMSALMPMLMGLLGKGEQNKNSPSNAESENSRRAYAPPSDRDGHAEKPLPHAYPEQPYAKNKQQNEHIEASPRHGQGMFAPISYAGYSLISALNLLCRHIYG